MYEMVKQIRVLGGLGRGGTGRNCAEECARRRQCSQSATGGCNLLLYNEVLTDHFFNYKPSRQRDRGTAWQTDSQPASRAVDRLELSPSRR